MIAFDCSKCQPEDQEFLGCEKPTLEPAWYFSKEEEWYNCPRKFVMDSTIDFIKEYDALKNNIAAPEKFNEQSAKFIEAIEVFEYWFITLKKLNEGK